jgi:glutathione S-transferase
MLKLYNHPISTCSQKVRVVLAEKGLDWENRYVALENEEHLQGWYLDLNPNGVVPTLVHDGAAIVDSSVINEYLEDVFPERPLRPADPVTRARMRAWRQYIDEVPTAAIRYSSFNKFFVRSYARFSPDEFAERAAARPLRKHFYQRMGQTGFSEAEIQASHEQLRSAIQRMDRSLRDGPWLVGAMFTLADVSILPTIVRLEDLGLTDLWSDLPRVADWYARIQARPSFALAYYQGTRQLGPFARPVGI